MVVWCCLIATKGLEHRRLRDLRTYEDFDRAVKEQVAHIIRLSAIGTVISQRVHRDIAPNHSCRYWLRGCMEQGKDVTAGGYDG